MTESEDVVEHDVRTGEHNPPTVEPSSTQDTNKLDATVSTHQTYQSIRGKITTFLGRICHDE